MSPRIAAELARLGKSLEALETAVARRGAEPDSSGFPAGGGGASPVEIARRVDRVIDRLETVLGE